MAEDKITGKKKESRKAGSAGKVKAAGLAQVGKAGAEEAFDPYGVIKSALSTEKVIRQIEFDNKLAFVIDRKASKNDVKMAVEKLFAVKVVKVNLHHSQDGQKRAYVKLSPAHLASDVSADLGMI